LLPEVNFGFLEKDYLPPEERVPNRFFGIRDLAYFKARIRDFKEKGGRDSGL